MERAAEGQRDVTLRVHPGAYKTLRALAEQAHKPLTQFLDDVAAREERRAFWEAFNASVERVKADPAAWEAYQAESRELDGTLMDGLEPGDDWHGVFDGETAPW